MILAIDVGNTNIVIGCIDEKKIHFVSRLDTNYTKTADEYAMDIKNILRLYDIPPNSFEGCIVCSVVPPLIATLQKAIKKAIGRTPMFVDSSMNNSFNIEIDNPNMLGSDLLVESIAAIDIYEVPMIIIDMGTATTLSVIDRNKSFIGGIIYPGLQISMETLTKKSSQLPSIGMGAPQNIICKNTIDAMQSGLIQGNASMIDGMIEKIEIELGEKTTIIATGGLASIIIPYCKKPIICDDNLILKGLLKLYIQNH